MFADWRSCHAKPTIKNVPEYIMRIGVKDPIFPPNYTIKGFMLAKKGFGRAYSAYILPPKDPISYQKDPMKPFCRSDNAK